MLARALTPEIEAAIEHALAAETILSPEGKRLVALLFAEVRRLRQASA